MYKNFLKRFFDFVISLAAFLILLGPFLIIMLLLSISNQGNPFFFQLRPGKGEKIFKVIKFRTMSNKKDQSGNLLPDSERLTATGKIIRRTSLDELPQLLNVIKGEMSLIGPRPLLPQYLSLYDETQKQRHDVRPGITGWAQVNGRNAISWQQKFEFDVWYVHHLSLLLDIKIIYLTIIKVLASEGINTEGSATAEPFKGN